MRVLIISKFFPPYQSARALQIGKVTDAIGKNAQIRVIAGLPDNMKGESDDNIHYVSYPKAKEFKNRLFRIGRRLLKEFESTNYFGSWVKKASGVAEKVICDFKPDVMMTSSSSFESHLVGLHLKKKMKILWVASFSDPWPAALMPVPYNVHSVPVLSRLQILMAKKVITECDAIHMPNKYAIDLIGKKLGLDIREKSYIIPHISNSFPKNIKIDLDLSDKLVHIGHLSRERVSIELLKAVKLLADQYKDVFGGMVCVGTVCPEFRRLVSEMQLDNQILILGQMSASKAMEYAMNSRVLLIIEANMKKSPFLPSKFVDYVAAKRPILAITPPISPVRDYLCSFSQGVAVEHNVDQIVEGIQKIFTRNFDDVLNENKEGGLMKEFTPSVVGSKYLSVLSDIENGACTNMNKI